MNNNDSKKFQILGNTGFPSQLDSFTNKKTPEWGLGVAKAIESEWFYRYNGNESCKFYTQRGQIEERRLYAKGLQTMSKAKKKLGLNGDISHVNLSDKSISRIPKIVDIVCNGFAQRENSIRAFGMDDISQDNRVSYRRQIEDDMYSKDFLIKAKEELGVDVSSMPIDQLPETKEELDLHMQLEYKQSIEMSAELAIETVFEENKYADTVEKRLRADLVIAGVGWIKNRFVKDRGILTEWVDCKNKIQSHTEDPFFQDCFYHGEFKTVLITDVLVDYPWVNDDPEVKAQIESSNSEWFNYHRLNTSDNLKGTTNLLFFTYKTTRERANKIKEKATGEKIVSKADENFKLKEGQTDDFKRVSVVEEVLFEGVYVLGTDILLKWEVSEYMSRPKSNKQKVVEQFIGCAPDRENGYIDSPVARMMSIQDSIDVLELKAQQIIQRILPDGYEIDVDGIAELDLGDGKKYTEQGVLDMFFETGSILTRSYGADGNYNQSKRYISELRTGGSIEKLRALREEKQGYLNDMLEVVGLNKASDASTPDKDSLVGLQKLAALNTNVAIRHILDASLYVKKGTAEAIIYRVQDLLKYSDLKDDFARKIGATAVMDLEFIKDLHLHDFAIFLDLALDDEEKAKLENDLTVEINKGALGVEDKYRIMSIKNLKMAISYLVILKKKRAKIEEERKMREIDAQTKGNIQSAQAAEQAKQQTAQLEAMVKSELQKLVDQGLIQKEVVKGEQDRLTAELTGNKKIEWQYVVNSGQVNKEAIKGENDKEKLLKNATNQSELIDQRLKDKGPIDFEQKENDIEIFNDINE